MVWADRWELGVAALAVLVPVYIGIKVVADLRSRRWVLGSVGLLIALGAAAALSIMAQLMFTYHHLHR